MGVDSLVQDDEQMFGVYRMVQDACSNQELTAMEAQDVLELVSRRYSTRMRFESNAKAEPAISETG